MERWPNFFIVGAPKAGTTSLYEYLDTIPDIFMSTHKEPHYFAINAKPILKNKLRVPIRDKASYLSFFKNVNDEKIIGEASSTYLADEDAPNLIHKISPEAHILISLRDPVERAISHYFMLRHYDITKSSINDVLRNEFQSVYSKTQESMLLRYGLYYEDVKRYLSIFDSDKMKIMIFEDWVNNVRETVQEILEFLTINYEVGGFKEEIHNPRIKVRGRLAEYILWNKPLANLLKKFASQKQRNILKEKFLIETNTQESIDDKSRDFLKNFYHDDVEKLQKLLSRKLPWENFEN